MNPAENADCHRSAESGPEEEVEHLGHAILARRLRFDTMDSRLLTASLGALASIALVAAAVATRSMSQPRLEVRIAPVGGGSVPVAVAIGATLILIVAWSYVATAALHASAPFRVLGLGVYSVAMIGLAVLGDAAGSELHMTHASAVRGTAAAGAAALLVLTLWGVAALQWTRDRVEHRDAPQRRHHHHIHHLTFWWAMGTTACVFALTWVAAGDVGAVGGAVVTELGLMEIPLIPIVMLAGSDFAEWGEVVGAHAVDLLRHSRVRRAAPALVIAATAAVLVDAGRQSWPPVRVVAWTASAAVELAIVAGLVWLLGRWVPRPTVSARGLFVAALISMLTVGTILLGSLGWAVGTLLWVLAALIALGLGLARHRWAAGCLIVAAAGVTTAFWLSPLLPQGDMQGFRLLFGGWLLVLVVWRWARRREPVLSRAAAHLIAVLAVIQVLSWALLWYEAGGAIGERLSVVAAVILFAAITWDILMSGGPVTNVHGARLPRHTRVLAYTGYAMLCAGTIALFSSWEGSVNFDFGIGHDIWPEASLFLLGLPAALTALVLGLRRR